MVTAEGTSNHTKLYNLHTDTAVTLDTFFQEMLGSYLGRGTAYPDRDISVVIFSPSKQIRG
jgi:hypothetical protein